MPKTGPNPCATCGSASKYTCPGCDMRSCSVGCVRTHKLATGCGGVRDKTKYVSMRAFGDATLVSDFAFLEDAARIADNAARDLTTSGLGGPGENGDKEKSRFHPVAGPKLSARETHLLRNCKSRRIAIRFMPKGMSRHDTNRSFFHHKTKAIWWSVEWIFQAATRISVLQHDVKENSTIKDIFATLLSPQSAVVSPEKHCQITQLARAPFESLQLYLRRENMPANEPAYHAVVAGLDATLSSVLAGKNLVEFPTFLVSLNALEAGAVVVETGGGGGSGSKVEEVISRDLVVDVTPLEEKEEKSNEPDVEAGEEKDGLDGEVDDSSPVTSLPNFEDEEGIHEEQKHTTKPK